jgi:hypothetical protein
MLHSLAHSGLGRGWSIRPALLLATLILAACSTTASRTELSATPISAAQKSAALAQKTVPSSAAKATPGSQQGSGSSAALRPCLARPPQVGAGCGPCPPALAAPLPLHRCPAPPNPPVPPAGAARISICAGLPVSLRTGPAPFMQSALCGSGFGAFEVVTITLTSPHGTTSWSTMAGPRGTFDSPLPSSICRFIPAQLVAHGNKGRVSNALSLGLTVCRPRM